MEILADGHAKTSSVFSYIPGVQQNQPIGDRSIDANYDRIFETAPRIELKGEPIGKPFARLFFEKRTAECKIISVSQSDRFNRMELMKKYTIYSDKLNHWS